MLTPPRLGKLTVRIESGEWHSDSTAQTVTDLERSGMDRTIERQIYCNLYAAQSGLQ